MSDIELAPDNTAAELSASATPTPTPKATPKGKGRGRGRKAVAKKVVVPASVAPPISATTAPRKAAGGRRGRTKQFDDDHIQSKYERQREIKSCYSELAQILKPALIELADRQIESMKKDANYHKQWPEYTVVTTELQGIADLRKEQADANYTLAIEAEHHRHRVSLEINDQVYHVSSAHPLEDPRSINSPLCFRTTFLKLRMAFSMASFAASIFSRISTTAVCPQT